MRRLLAAGVVVLTLAGCASSMDTYSRQDVGRVIETTPGTVVSSRPVNITGKRSGLGAAAGGATGGVIGATSFGGSGGAVAGVLLGIAGAVAGTLAEEAITSDEGYEYTIQTDDGRVVTVVQRAEGETPPIGAGTPVRVQWGADYARVIPIAGTTPPPAGTAPGEDDWINPDDLEPGAPATTGVSPPPGAVVRPADGLGVLRLRGLPGPALPARGLGELCEFSFRHQF